MGARGPLPKARRTRPRDDRRRQAATTTLAGGGRNAPTLPNASGLPDVVLEWWATLWASPIAAEFADVDHPGLVRMALLWARSVEGQASAAELGELRQLESAFGL